jgi:hypothetical protein
MSNNCPYCIIPYHYFPTGNYCLKCGYYSPTRDINESRPTLQQLATYLPESYNYGCLELSFDCKWDYQGYYIHGVKVPFYPFEEAKKFFLQNVERQTPTKLVRLSRYLVDDRPVPIEILGCKLSY